MKLNIITIRFFLASLLSVSILASYSIYGHHKIFKEQINNYIASLAGSAAEQVNIFLQGKKERAIDFSSDGFIQNNLKSLKDNYNRETMQELSEHLIKNKIVVDKSFYEVFALDSNGKLVGTTNPKKEYGKDFAQEPIFLEGKQAPYVKDYFYDEEYRRNGITISAPVLKQGEFVGVIVIKMSLEELIEIVVKAGDFKEYGQIYLIDKNFLLATPSKFLRGENAGLGAQTVDTENSRNCFQESAPGHSTRSEPIFSFLNYKGEKVIGTHREIKGANWCLLTEIEEEKGLLVEQNKFMRNQIIISIFIVGFLTLIGFFVGRLFKKQL